MNTRPNHADEVRRPFPVLEERSLVYVPRRFLRVTRRDLDDLPDVRPGTVLVFRHGSRYVAFNGTKHMTGAEEPVVDATAVSLVDIRARDFTVHFQMSSASPADDFTIRATFRARVTDPERVAEEGPLDLGRYLMTYLAHDPKLLKLGESFPVEALAEVRDQVVSRIDAYCDFNPINVAGLSIKLVSSTVLPSHELRLHEREKRDEIRRQAVEKLRTDAEDRSIKRHEDLVAKGSDTLAAVGIARGETSVSEIRRDAREDERQRQERLEEIFRILQKDGALEYVDVDLNEIVKDHLERLTGKPIPRLDHSGLRSGEVESRGAIGSSGDDEDDDAPDEADLDE
jgi:hypothetical protein